MLSVLTVEVLGATRHLGNSANQNIIILWLKNLATILQVKHLATVLWVKNLATLLKVKNLATIL